MDRVIELTKNPEVPPRYAEAIYKRLYGLTPFYILSNAFLYSPLQVNVSSMERLEAMGFYPVPLRAGDTRYIKTIKRLMNRRRLWLLLYRIVHLLPDRFIYKHFNV